jgi:hypothetical protein
LSYKYFPLGISSDLTTGSIILNDFQTYINDQFANSPNYYTIQEELVQGSRTYSNVEVRVTNAISSYTGEKLGDDFKSIIFKDLAHASSIGTKYMLDQNTFLTINSEIIKNFAASATIRRCNNTLRWVDSDGVRYSEECILEYKLNRPKDTMGAIDPVQEQGYTEIYCQLNARTRTIRGNQRFLFGPAENRICLKVFSNGIRNYINQETSDDTSGTMLQLSVGGREVNPLTDDITNGYADAYKNYGNLTSGSHISSTIDIVVTPNENFVFQSEYGLFDVHYHSGSNVLTGSFVFSVNDANVPVANYIFNTESANTFSIFNVTPYADADLNIKCSGSSGSRILPFELKGVY